MAAYALNNDSRLTKRWSVLRLHKEQSNCFRSVARFNLNHSGRRSGKTELLGKRKIIKKALRGAIRFPDWRCFVSAPVRHQAKKIYWKDLKQLIPKKLMLREPNESELIIYLINGSEIHVVGMDRPERIEGQPWDHGLLDEFGNMKPQTWEEHVRPALSDRKGSCDFIGVPEGRNHYYDLKEFAREEVARGSKDWALWHWPSWEIIDPEEVEAAKRDMDELVYMQEYGGEFIAFTGMAYYTFNPKVHVGKYRKYYDPKRPIVFCFDFNVSPGVAVIGQEMTSDTFPDIGIGNTVTTLIGEVYIPKQSNTIRICKKLIDEWKNHKGIIICYGDATGGSEGTAKVHGNDWSIIKQQLYPYFGDRLYFKVPESNPRERQRVNAVNSRLLTYTGKVRMVIDGEYCPKTVKDFEGVRVIEGTAGEIDKKSDKLLTHLTDAVGYYIHREYPIQKYYTAEDIREMMARRNKAEIDEAMRRAA